MRMLALVAIGFLAGCGGSSAPATVEKPMTIAEWEGLPADRKFQAESYERLKLGEPKFQDEKNWDRFYKQTILPARKKEMGTK
jgi:hypothetical protein